MCSKVFAQSEALCVRFVRQQSEEEKHLMLLVWLLFRCIGSQLMAGVQVNIGRLLIRCCKQKEPCQGKVSHPN